MTRKGDPLHCAVTGLGAITAWGRGSDALWAGLCSSRTAIDHFDRFDSTGYTTQIAAQVPGYESLASSRHSLADRFGIDAALEAVSHAQLEVGFGDRKAGVYFGSSTGGLLESEAWYGSLAGRPARSPGLSVLSVQQVNAPAEAVARAAGACGPVETVSSACASSTLAIGMALDALRSGTVDVAIAGGADSLCRVTYGGFNALRSVDPRPSRPFRACRQGLSLGEGGAVLVLERASDAARRGRRPLAELRGAGGSCDAHHMTAPDPSGHGPARALRLALDDSRCSASDVDFINTHGTGTALNDGAEYAALQSVFGDRTPTIPVSASKASIGHLLGTAGAVEAVITVLCLQHQRVHPTPGEGTIDELTPVRLVRDAPLEGSFDVGISLNLAFGGTNGALVFGRSVER